MVVRLSRNCATQILNFVSCSDSFRYVIISTFSCSSRLLRALNNMHVEGMSLGYMEIEILSGLITFACEGRSNCGVMFGSGGDECAAFASLESV